MNKFHVSANVNGDDVEFLCDPRETLLDCLRDKLNLTGAKEGCGTGDCGACSVTVDGRLVCSCLMLGVEAVDAVLFGSREVTLDHANIVNATKNTQMRYE